MRTRPNVKSIRTVLSCLYGSKNEQRLCQYTRTALVIIYIAETDCVFCAVRAENLVSFKGLRVSIHCLMWPMVLTEGLCSCLRTLSHQGLHL